MNETKFGFGQFWEHTPKAIKQVRAGLNYLLAAGVIYIPTVAEWCNTSTDNISSILGIALLLVNTVGHMFGIDTQENTSENEK